MRRYGLIGERLGHSFSPKYFSQKFNQLNIKADYRVFELKSISEFPQLIDSNHIHGLNVTIPYKEAIIPYLDRLDSVASRIGAVNTIVFEGGQLIGYNTDAEGFEKTIVQSGFCFNQKNALILGSGGASKAISYALNKLGFHSKIVSRKAHYINYQDVTSELMASVQLIINTTPLGTYPNTQHKPPLNTKSISEQHFVYDLIYNPEKTEFLRVAETQRATIQNGLQMLQNQAELSYQLWTQHI